MFCRTCGKTVPDQALMCMGCGCPPKAGSKFCSACGAETPPGATLCPRCHSATTPPPLFSIPAPTIPGADKKLVAGLCAILVGSFGIHKFILGYTNEGVIMLLVTLLTCGIGAVVMHVIALIEGITYLTKSDADFVNTYVLNKKAWL